MCIPSKLCILQVQVGDTLLSVNGVVVRGMPLTDVLRAMEGPHGTVSPNLPVSFEVLMQSVEVLMHPW